MGIFKLGDLVARKSYGYDILFKVVDVKNSGEEDIIILKGIAYRIQADAPESDLVLQTDQRMSEDIEKMCEDADKKHVEILDSIGPV